jgi:hypothetical protein
MKTVIGRVIGVITLTHFAIPSIASAAFTTVYGSPPYTPGAGGYVARDGEPPKVNNSGMAVSSADRYDPSGVRLGVYAVRWDASGAAVELASLDTNGRAAANAINNAGVVVGLAEPAVGTVAVRWSAAGGIVELGSLGTDSRGVAEAEAYALNSSGTAVGYAMKYIVSGADRGQGPRAVRWDASGTAATDLGSLGTSTFGSTDSRALDINDAGVSVGYARKYAASGVDKGYRAVRWEASGVAVELGNLGTDSAGYTNTSAGAINSAGMAVGTVDKYDASGAPTGGPRAVRWDASGVALELSNPGTSPVAGSSSVYDINDAGTAVGFIAKIDASHVSRGIRAVRWDASGAATEMGTLGTDVAGFGDSIAFAINSAGIAIGYANDYDGEGQPLGRKPVYWGPDGVPVELNTLIDPASGWTLTEADAISDTNWISAYQRGFLIQVPEPTGVVLLSLAATALLRRRHRLVWVHSIEGAI